MKRVCVVTNLHEPNDDRIFYKEILSLAKRYGRITLIAPNAEIRDQAFRTHVDFIPLKSRRTLTGRVRSVFEIVGILRTLQPDVVHFHDYDLIAAVPFLSRIDGARLVYDVHEAYSEMLRATPRPIPGFARSLLALAADTAEKAMARRCDLVVTADTPTAATFMSTGTPTITVFNYPPLELFGNAQLSREVAQRFAGRNVILYHGTMSANRGLFHMIRAMSILKKSDPSVTLLLIGLPEGALHTETQHLITELGVADNVSIIPWVDHTSIHSYIRIASIGLVPWQPIEKHKRNIPIKVFEYMACGVPVLGADLPSVTPYIAESRAGRVYDSTDAESLARNVSEMLADPEGLKAMGDRGLRAVREQWNWEKMEERLLTAYARLLEGPGRHHRQLRNREALLTADCVSRNGKEI